MREEARVRPREKRFPLRQFDNPGGGRIISITMKGKHACGILLQKFNDKEVKS